MFGQRIVDQTSINPFEPVTLFDPLSLLAFSPSITEGSEFPDFQTISTENEVFDLNGILLDAIQHQKVPVIAFGRPSCNQLRDLYQHILLPTLGAVEDEVSVFHLANSVEAHATNGYLTPYYGVFEGEIFSATQIPFVNVGYEFLQPYTGDQLVTYSAGFANKMIETGVGEIDDFEEITILLDNPSGGFTNAFQGPAIIWVINPFDGSVAYESVDFQCAVDQPSDCSTERDNLLDAIRDVQALFGVVGIDETVEADLIELKNFNLLGQDSRSGLRLFYNPITKQKVLRHGN